MYKMFKVLVAVAVVFAFTSAASATSTVIKFGLGDTGPDVTLNFADVFETIDDGNAATTGNQDTNVDFTGPLSFLPDILAGASFSLAGVAMVGAANVLPGGVFSQATGGGAFAFFTPANSVLLTGVIGPGTLTGQLGGTVGSWFSSAVTFTGGLLMPFIHPTPGGLSISLTDVTTAAGASGFGVNQCRPGGALCDLAAFTADATGNVEAEPIPEPATMGLMLMGLLGGAAATRRKKIA
jgi:hypothetical protein